MRAAISEISASERETSLAQEAALKAAAEIVTQARFAALDASNPDSLSQAAARFDAILHYSQRALRVLEQAAKLRRDAVQ